MLRIYVADGSGNLLEELKDFQRYLGILPLEIIEGDRTPPENFEAETELCLRAFKLNPNLQDLERLKGRILDQKVPALIGIHPSQYDEKDLKSIQNALGGLTIPHFYLNFEAPQIFEGQNLLHFFTSLFSKPLEKDRNSLEKIGASLNRVIQNSLAELQKIKRIHEKVVPMRKEGLQGLEILSKFSAGESPGGEFFDFVKKEQQGLLLVSSSSSYVVSSIILSHFEMLKMGNDFSHEMMEKFVKDLTRELKDKSLGSDHSRTELFIARVDLGKMAIEGHSFGNFQFLSGEGVEIQKNDSPLDETFFEKTAFQKSLARGERYLLFSPGVFENLEDGKPDDLNEHSFPQLLEKKGRESINEVFFQMSRQVSGDFLKSDATVLSLEVDANVIRQV